MYEDTLIFAVDFDFETLEEKIIYLLVNDVFIKILPVGITSYFYYKVYQTLKKLSALYPLLRNSSKMLYFVFLPIICFLPTLITDVMAVGSDDTSQLMEFIKVVMYHTWGILNLWCFSFLKPAKEKEASPVTSNFLNESLHGLSETNFGEISISDSKFYLEQP